MKTKLPRRLAHRLPAYHSGLASERERAWVERQLARRPEWRAASDRVAQVVAALRANDPASPVDPAEVERLLPALRRELASQRPSLARLRPMPAAAVAMVLFAGGLLTGAQAFPRTVEIDRPVTVERRVEVPVERIVEVPVERLVEVPVERVVTRWRTRTVYRTRTVTAAAPSAPTAPPAEPTRVVQVPTAARPTGTPAGSVPVSVQF